VGFIVVVPALLALLFSISTTGTLPRPTLAPVFDTAAAAALSDQLSTEYPSRVPGTVDAERAARWYSETISTQGLTADEDVWTEDLPDLGSVELRNIVTVIPGRSEETIVLVAHRDNAGTSEPLGDNASGTAALIELGRGFAPPDTGSNPLPQRTLVLVSTDGGAYGGAGAARFAETSSLADHAIAVVVLDGLGAGGRPRLAIAGESPASPARAFVSTASARIREQVGVAPSLPSVPTQLVDLGVPFAAGEQGPFLAHGIAAIMLTTAASHGSTVLPRGPTAPLAVAQFGQLGRATDALVGSLDASVGGAFRTPDSVFAGHRAASGWTVRLILVLSVVPFALGVLDLFVRGRRRGLPLMPALRGLRARLLFWLYGGFLLWLGGITGVFPTGAGVPPPPYTSFVVDPATAGLLLLAIALALGWLAGRRRLIPTATPSSEEQLAGYAVGLSGLGAIAVACAITKPYALLFILPSLYAWIWLPLTGRSWQRIALFCLGLAGPLLGLGLLASQLQLAALETPLYVAGLATVGYLPMGTVLLAIAWAAVASQFGALAFGRYAPYASGLEPPPPGVVRQSVRCATRRARSKRA
jgi:hypothetical protein